MHPIQFVDLQSQYKNIKPAIDQAIENTLQNTSFIKGPQVLEFESLLTSYLNFHGHTITCGNGTDALQIALMALDLKPGDEVIIPSFTYIATVEAAAILGIKPVFVDVSPETFGIDTTHLADYITKKTKAIIPVHLFGQCADMEPLLTIARKNNIPIIEDAAQSLGAEYIFKNHSVKAGTMGDIGITSFFPSKNLGCFGDGGALFTQDSVLAERIRMIANHGQKSKYYHEIIGMNSRLDTIQAAVLLVKLQELDKYISARQKAAEYYDRQFAHHPNIQIPARATCSTHTFNQYTLIIKDADRDDLKKYLQAKNIPTMTYYPLPVHLQGAYAYLGYNTGDFPIAEGLCQKVLSIPMHTELDNEQLSYIAENILEYFN